MLDLMLLDSEERIKAFTHPYRLKLLHVLRSAQLPMTATEVARALGDGPGRVHYHMRILEAAGIVGLARTETVNGIVARYYQPSARHYSVSDAARGAVGGEPMRDEVARMISRRFRDGLRAFLDRTIGDSGAPGNDAFLFEYIVHCNDDQWLAFRDVLEDLVARYATQGTDTRARHFFVAGATDRPLADNDRAVRPDRAKSRHRGQDWLPHPGPER